MRLERQLRPEVFGRRQGGYIDRRRTAASSGRASPVSIPGIQTSSRERDGEIQQPDL